VAETTVGKMQISEIMEATLHPRAPAPGFAAQPGERARPISLPAWFIDRCREAFLDMSFPGPRRVLGVTSAVAGEGKTTIALGMAMAVAADTDEWTLLLECDLETGSDEVFGVTGGAGLGEWLEGDERLRILRIPPTNNAFLIPAGGARPDAARVFYRLTHSNLIEDLQQEFPNVIIDLPPVLNIAYRSLAAKVAEQILLVVRYGSTRMEDVEQAVDLLGNERISGIILNGYAPKTPSWLRRLL
jgi:Mrp family chromosome partitioning ATPase